MTVDGVGEACLWDPDFATPIARWDLGAPPVGLVTNACLAAVALPGNTMRVIDGDAATLGEQLSLEGVPVRFLEGDRVALRVAGGLRIVTRSGARVADFPLDDVAPDAPMAVSSDGSVLVTSTETELRLRDLARGTWCCTIPVPEQIPGGGFDGLRRPLVAASRDRFAWCSPYRIEIRDFRGGVLFEQTNRFAPPAALFLREDGRLIVDRRGPDSDAMPGSLTLPESAPVVQTFAGGRLVAEQPWFSSRGNLKGDRYMGLRPASRIGEHIPCLRGVFTGEPHRVARRRNARTPLPCRRRSPRRRDYRSGVHGRRDSWERCRPSGAVGRPREASPHAQRACRRRLLLGDRPGSNA